MTTDLGSQQPCVSESVVNLYVKLATAFVFVVLATVWSVFSRVTKGKLPPGPFPLPIIGNLHMLGKLPHRALAALSMKHGPLMSLRLGSSLTLVVSSPEIAREFLKTHDQVFANKGPSAAAKHLSFNFADIIFSPYRPYWAQMRKLCTLELLSSKRLDGFRFIREDEVFAMIRSIINSDAYKGCRPLNINKNVASLATAVICRMAFSKRYSDQDSRAFNSMVKESLLLLGTFNVGDYIPYMAWMDLQGLNRRMKKLHTTQDQLLEKVIEEHVAQNGTNTTHDLVDVLLAASTDRDREVQISRDSIKGILFDMLLGGSDTAPTIIEWAMSEALINPPVMKKLQDELERVVGLDRMACESDLPQLVYLQAMVKETLRLHPAGPLLNRRLSAESCNVLGYEFPKNTRVLVNAWVIGRNPKLWEDAETFKPERFTGRVGHDLRLSSGNGKRKADSRIVGSKESEGALRSLGRDAAQAEYENTDLDFGDNFIKPRGWERPIFERMEDKEVETKGEQGFSRVFWQRSRRTGQNISSQTMHIDDKANVVVGRIDGTTDKMPDWRLDVKRTYSGDSQKIYSRDAPNTITSRIQNLEFQLSSTLGLLRSGKDATDVNKDEQSFLEEFEKASDALEFQETEIMKMRAKLRSTHAKLAAMEGKMTMEILEVRKAIEEKQRKLEEAQKVLCLMRAVRIVWPNSAAEVLLAGSFDGWTSRKKMKKSNAGVFVISLQLYPGRYEIKFIVDGVWKVDPQRPVVYNNGFENNLLMIY